MCACTSWKVQLQPYPDRRVIERAGSVRVTTQSGRMRIDRVKFIDDTLRGRQGSRDVRVPMADVRQLELLEPSGGGTFGVLVVVGIVVGLVVVALTLDLGSTP